LPDRDLSDTLLGQNVDVVFHDVLAASDAFRILLDGQLLCCPLETEEALDVKLGALFEAGPFRILRVNGVEANFVDDDPVGERLVPRVNGQGAVLLVECVSLPEDEVVHTHDLLQQVRRFDGKFGSAVNDVEAVGLVDILLHDLRLLDDGDHVAGGESHLVGLHDQLKRLLVDPNRRLILLNHFEEVFSSMSFPTLFLPTQRKNCYPPVTLLRVM